ncbi:MAG: hypothetical protein KAQ83_02835 [Nanoarchaeota archaeon]|nr:hypothetical protein [Nanoarchaeota archaeon]
MINEDISTFGQFILNQQARVEATLENYELVNNVLRRKSWDDSLPGREARKLDHFPTGAVYIVTPELFFDWEKHLILCEGEGVPIYNVEKHGGIVPLFQSFRDDDVALAYCPELGYAARFKMIAVPNVIIKPRKWFSYDQLEQEDGVFKVGCKWRTIAANLETLDGLIEVIAAKQTISEGDDLDFGRLMRVDTGGEREDLAIRKKRDGEPSIYFDNPNLTKFNGLMNYSGRRLTRNDEEIIVPEINGVKQFGDIYKMLEFLTGQQVTPESTRYNFEHSIAM